tara:strand:+ start:1656 stop:2513 length:858 start_codon:yes stop_codon:yes gene_type:complete
MKIIFVAVFTEKSTNTSQSYSLKKCGVDVIEFNYRDIARSIGNKHRDDLLIETCITEKVDAVLFSKCNEIDYRVVDECNKYCKTILWYMDPLNGNFNSILINKIKRCTYIFCALWDSYLKAKEICDSNVYFLHEGYDQTKNYPIDIEQANAVTFIGELRGHRHDYYNNHKFNIISNAYAEEHSKAVSSSKINLNFTHGGTSDRTYKVLASKGFLLTEPWPMMEKDFTIGKDLDIFKNIEEFKEKIKYYLNNEKLRLTIANNGFKTVQKFNRINWAKKIIDIVYEK